MDVRVIIAAAGGGTRFGQTIPKQFVQLGGESILKHTIRRFECCGFVEEIAVVLPPGFVLEEDIGYAKVKNHIVGKKTRAESVYEGLKKISHRSFTSETVVLVHDGVRPFVSEKIIENVILEAMHRGAAIAATKVIDTIKQVDVWGFVSATVNRENLWRAATPQGFRMGILLDSFKKAEAHGYLEAATDEAFIVEKAGFPVFIVEGNPENIKITTQSDMAIAEEFLKKEGQHK